MQRAGLHQRAHAFLEEERVAGGALAQHRGQRRQRGIAPEECCQQRARVVRGKRIEPQLAVI